MYDINYKNIKKGRLIWFIFLAFAILFLTIAGVIAFTSVQKQKRFTGEATSYRYDIDSHRDDDGDILYTPIYYYQVNGKEYTCRSSVSSSSATGDRNKIIYYLPGDPEQCSTGVEDIKMFLIMFSIVPVIFIVISTIGLLSNRKKVKAVMELNQVGKLVKKIPCRVENSNVQVNGRYIPRIVLDYVLPDGTTARLTSEPIYDRTFRSDGFADLVIDESNPSKYYIDKEINRLEGNRSEDYYTLPGTTNNNAANDDGFVSAFDI